MVVEATPPVPLFTVVVCHDARSRWSVNWKEATMKKREKKKEKRRKKKKESRSDALVASDKARLFN